MTGLTLVTAPSVEPALKATAKAFMRITIADDDDLIDSLIVGARRFAESFTRRQLITASWKQTFRSLPAVVTVRKPPLQSITHLKYVDTGGDEQTFDSSYYLVDTDSEPGRVAEAYGYSWPDTRDQMAAIRLTFVAGYGDATTDLPQDIIDAVLLHVSIHYEQREGIDSAALDSVRHKLWPYRVFSDW